MACHETDIVIIGGGIVGLCIAYQLLENKISSNIILVEKEKKVGQHSSGRNSGVLHAGLYYQPTSLKAQVCIAGAKRLKSWIQERELPLNPCGKVIVPQEKYLDSQLEVLEKRGKNNGAKVEFINAKQLKKLIPEARTSTDRALWSPETAVVKPIKVIEQLENELKGKGVNFYYSEANWTLSDCSSSLKMSNGDTIMYKHLFNCAGLQADRIAQKFGVGSEYNILPFKGLYWQMKAKCPINLKTNLYPVPDLNVPFLGVHFTPNTDPKPVISIGPTATLALGRENYQTFNSIEPAMAANNIRTLIKQYFGNNNGFRNYVHDQAFLNFHPLLLRSAQKLIPKLQSNHLQRSQKVGIRAQLFNNSTQCLENDFLCLPGHNSTHVLNAISPAFTASFALADLIIDRAVL